MKCILFYRILPIYSRHLHQKSRQKLTVIPEDEVMSEEVPICKSEVPLQNNAMELDAAKHKYSGQVSRRVVSS